MIPSVDELLTQDFAIEEQTSHTYRMDFDKLNIRGVTDHQQAMVQAIYKILNTQRYQYEIYSWDYGVEFLDLFGEPISFVLPEIRRRIEDALMADNRMMRVDHFDFAIEKGVVHTTFTAYTTYGDFVVERAVNF